MKSKLLEVVIKIENGVGYVARKSSGVKVVIMDYDCVDCKRVGLHHSHDKVLSSDWEVT